ncbi:MAG: SUMF1/EgtB/PvdO family nonheme iron enzyme, partial [Blastocatellia bacterium]
MSLPVRLDPTDFVPLARPGRTEPDFVFYPQNARPVPFYGAIELKRPDSRIFTRTRSNVALFTRDAETAIEQALSFARSPGGLVPIERCNQTLVVGNRAYLFVIMGMSEELAQRAGVELYTEMIQRKLPGNLQILPYDELLRMFESALQPRIMLLVADTDSWFEFETVTLDEYGSVRTRERRRARQFVEELAPGVVLEMVEIPGGTFTMGSPKEEEGSAVDERPQHEVTVSRFQMEKYTVTQAQWRVVAGWPKVDRDLDAEPSDFKGDELPVEQLSWENAVEFCARLSKRTREYYRLPTEWEWEYACRAGTSTPFAFGVTVSPEFVNYAGNYPYRPGRDGNGLRRDRTVPVGSLGVANGFGLYDMHGNVWEWCQDWYG